MLLTVLPAIFVGLLVQPAPADHPTAADLLKQITGVRRAPEDRTPRTSDLDEKVFGAGASNVRNVTLTIDAEERYLDGGRERWPVDGARVSITVIDPASGELEFRFDTKDGRGSFGTGLKRRRQS